MMLRFRSDAPPTVSDSETVKVSCLPLSIGSRVQISSAGHVTVKYTLVTRQTL